MSDDGIKKGSRDDPVAQSIRNEQMRGAVPSPEERREQEREFLRENGCRDCDEDDPDELHVTFEEAGQGQINEYVICKDCHDGGDGE